MLKRVSESANRGMDAKGFRLICLFALLFALFTFTMAAHAEAPFVQRGRGAWVRRSGGDFSPAHPPPSTPAPQVPDRILVKFKAGVGLLAMAQVNARSGATVEGKISGIGVQVVKVRPGQVASAIAAYKGDPRVEYAEPDYIAEAAYDPNDPYYRYGYQWGLQKIEAPSAWDLSTGHSEVIVAVVDSGVAPTHPDLRDKLVPGYNFVSDSQDTADDHGHGTHMAGIIAATADNGIGIAGVSFHSRIMPVKVIDSEGRAWYSRIAQGIVYAADHGAKVINLSLGGYAFSSYLQDAVDYAWNRGAVVVAAAGNGNTDEPFYPAAYVNAIAVSATDRNDSRAPFSNYGSYISVAAPGVGVYSTYWHGGSNYYASMSGTSTAAAYVSGIAALLLSQDSTQSNDAVRSVIRETADDLGEAGWDQYYGYGRVNLYRALKATQPAIVSFRALGSEGKVLLEWDASHEFDGLGFNLWRSNSWNGGYTRLNDSPIPTQSPGGGARAFCSYSYADEDVIGGVTYYYKLEAVALAGHSAWYGPVFATLTPQRFYMFLPLVTK